MQFSDTQRAALRAQMAARRAPAPTNCPPLVRTATAPALAAPAPAASAPPAVVIAPPQAAPLCPRDRCPLCGSGLCAGIVFRPRGYRVAVRLCIVPGCGYCRRDEAAEAETEAEARADRACFAQECEAWEASTGEGPLEV